MMRQSLYTLCALFFSAALLLWANPLMTNVLGEARADSAAEKELARGAQPAMPGQCRTGKTSPEGFGWRWNAGASVKVYYLKGDFNAAQLRALTRAVDSWNDALREIDSGIRFIVGGEQESILRENGSVTVMRGIPTKKERLGEIRFYATAKGLTRMVLTVRPVITDPDALTSLMTHELGHSLGLADCYECRRGTTAMSAFKDDNKGNDVYEPSACDKYVVAAGYAGTGSPQPSRLAASERR